MYFYFEVRYLVYTGGSVGGVRNIGNPTFEHALEVSIDFYIH